VAAINLDHDGIEQRGVGAAGAQTVQIAPSDSTAPFMRRSRSALSYLGWPWYSP
jgi:hypothetical protein